MSDYRQYGFPWTDAEFLVVLDAYFKYRGTPRHVGVAWVQDMAFLLGRTPAAVAIRLENFASVDPAVDDRVGMNKGGAKCEKLFRAYESRRTELAEIARVTLEHQRAARQPTLFEKPVEIPRAFGRYELLDQLGEGGFGRVYSCVDTQSGNLYAMKLLRRDIVGSGIGSEEYHRFRREIRVLKDVSHPGVIRLYDDNLDEDRSDPAFVMELASGSLRAMMEERAASKRLAGGPIRPVFSVDEAIDVVRAIGGALHVLHTEHKLGHRDLNPSNVFRRFDGSWVLADFGLAKFLATAPQGASYFTQRSQAGWGTEGYTAPEQWSSFGAADHLADVYSLGVLLWDMLGSRSPPIRPDALGLPEGIDKIVKRAVEYEPDKRYPSVRAFLDDLEAIIL